MLGDEAAEFDQVIAEHQASARDRRGREAARVGWSWLLREDVPPENAAPARDEELV